MSAQDTNRTSLQARLLVALAIIGIALCCSLACANMPAYAATASDQGDSYQAGALLSTQAAKAHWQTTNGKKQYILADGTKATGLRKINGYYYFFSDYGNMLTNSLKSVQSGSKKYTYYFGKDGKAATSCWKTINKETYYFKSNGRAASGLTKIGGYTYFFSDAGKMQTGYKKFADGSMYFFNTKGKAITGIKKIPDKDYSFYFNGDGTIKKSAFVKEKGKLYFMTKDGILCKADWRNVGKFDCGGDPLYIHCDPTTGEVAQGMTTFKRSSDNTTNTYYFDRTAPLGYRTGVIKAADGKTYNFVETGNIGFLHKGFYTDLDKQKVYYFDLKTGAMKTSGSVSIPDTTVKIKVKSDGALNLAAAAKFADDDSTRTRLVKVALSQVFQPYGQTLYTTLMNASLSSEIKYNCSGFILKVYKEALGQDIFAKDNDVILHMDSLYTKEKNIKAGDLVFFNMDDCNKKTDPSGKSWMIDNNNDKKCDRIHSDLVKNGKSAHVHHISIYLGNGQIIDAGAGLGVTMRPLSRVTNIDTFYVFCYGRVKALK